MMPLEEAKAPPFVSAHADGPRLSDREIAEHYTLQPDERAAVSKRRRDENRLGFAVQLAVLRFPGHFLLDLPPVPPAILQYIAAQVGVAPDAFAHYGDRRETVYEHFTLIRKRWGYRIATWRDLRALLGHLVPVAHTTHQDQPVRDAAMAFLRARKIVAPNPTRLDEIIARAQAIAKRQIETWLVGGLAPSHLVQLDTLLQSGAGRGKRGPIPLTWLREPPSTPSPKALDAIRTKWEFLRTLQLPPLPVTIHRTRLLKLARKGAEYTPHALHRLPPNRRYPLLRAHLAILETELVDAAVDMFDKLVGELHRKGERRQQKLVKNQAKDLNRTLYTLTTATDALLQAHADGTDPLQAVFAVVSEAHLQVTVKTAKDLVRPPNFDYLDLLEPKYVPIRRALLDFYGAFTFQPARTPHPVIQALDHIVALSQEKKRVTTTRRTTEEGVQFTPLTHLTDRWRDHVVDGGVIAPNMYEASAFDGLRARLRSGDIAVEGSKRYASFESYLLPPARWQAMEQTGQTALALNGDVGSYLMSITTEIEQSLAELQTKLHTIPGLTVDADGILHIVPLEKDVPEEANVLKRRLYRMLPRIHLADLLIEVDGWTGCLGHLINIRDNQPPRGKAKWMVLAALMALGLNIGLTKMAESTPYSYAQLAWAAGWYLREETLTKVRAELDNVMLHHPLSQVWGDGTTSSSDGMRIPIAVRAANADRNAQHFGTGRGATLYSHVADIWMPYSHRLISTNDREALYVIDALCHHETDLTIQEHYTDTHGFTHHVFALCKLLGFQFAPRIADVLHQQLVTLGPPPSEGPLHERFERLNPKTLVEQWDQLQRLAASIKHGTVAASLLMRKLAAYPQQNQLAKATADMGKLEKTAFILKLIQDRPMQRRVQRGLNKGESVQALARALFFGQRGELRDRAFQDQLHRASALHVLMAAIITWNTVYLGHAVETLRARGEQIPDELLSHVAPTGWEHTNFLGRYSFDAKAARPLHALRPLRDDREIDGEHDEREHLSNER